MQNNFQMMLLLRRSPAHLTPVIIQDILKSKLHRFAKSKRINLNRLTKFEFRTMSAYKPVTHVIFDLDGLLLDTEKLYLEAGRKVCAKYKKEYTYAIHVEIAGLLGTEASAVIVSKLNLPVSPEEYYAEVKKLYKTMFQSTQLKPDTEHIYFKAQKSILDRFGKTYTNDLRLKILGTVELDTAKTFINELNLPISAEDFVRLQSEGVNADMPNASLKPGAERLIRHLVSHSIPIAVATSSSLEHVELKLSKHQDLFSLMHHLTSGTSDKEVKKGKPAPDIFLVCASKFEDKPSSDKVLVFEDAPNGVTAGLAAGMQVVMVPEPHIPKEKRVATLVLDSLEQFQPELFSLPPF